jgi:hypothetical protein
MKIDKFWEVVKIFNYGDLWCCELAGLGVETGNEGRILASTFMRNG